MSDKFTSPQGQLPQGLRSSGKRAELKVQFGSQGSGSGQFKTVSAAERAGYVVDMYFNEPGNGRDVSLAFRSQDFNLSEGRARLGRGPKSTARSENSAAAAQQGAAAPAPNSTQEGAIASGNAGSSAPAPNLSQAVRESVNAAAGSERALNPFYQGTIPPSVPAGRGITADLSALSRASAGSSDGDEGTFSGERPFSAGIPLGPGRAQQSSFTAGSGSAPRPSASTAAAAASSIYAGSSSSAGQAGSSSAAYAAQARAAGSAGSSGRSASAAGTAYTAAGNAYAASGSAYTAGSRTAFASAGATSLAAAPRTSAGAAHSSGAAPSSAAGTAAGVSSAVFAAALGAGAAASAAASGTRSSAGSAAAGLSAQGLSAGSGTAAAGLGSAASGASASASAAASGAGAESAPDLKRASLNALRSNPIMENHRRGLTDDLPANALSRRQQQEQSSVAGDDQDLMTIRPSLADDEVPNQPGPILKHAREMLGLTQQDIAERLKLRVNSINDIEHDRLNQPTAAAFVRGYIADYARLVNIDPKVVVELYDQNVQALRAQSAAYTQERARRARRSSARLRHFVYGFIFIAIALGLGLNYIYSSDDSANNAGTEEELILDHGSSGAVFTDNGGEEYSGELSFKDEGSGAPAAQGAQPPAPAKPADLNTMRAQMQADALGTNELTEEDLSVSTEVDTTDALVTSAAPVRTPAPAPLEVGAAEGQSGTLHAAAPAQNPGAPASTAPAAPASGSAPKPAPAHETAAAPRPAPAPVPAQPAAPAPQPVIVDNQHNGTEGSLTLKEPTPALSSTLRDVSSQVSIRNRDGLASLNSATFRMSGKVFLRVTDSRGKVLASGNYDAGNSVKVTGIPPIKVEVTDSSRIAVSYAGGTLSMPQARQVQFTLPQR